MKPKFAFLLLSVFVAALLSLKLGTIQISWSEMFSFFVGKNVQAQSSMALGFFRIPRTAAAFFVGSTLAVAGTLLQSLLRNPLADSYTLGISGGSAVGASLAMHLALLPAFISIPLFSFLGALFAVVFVLLLAGKTLKYESRTLILVGLMTSLFLGAVSVFSISILPIEKNQSALSWLMGEFGSPRDNWVATFYLLATAPWVFIFKKSAVLDILSLGDVKSVSLGLNPRREKTALILTATFLTSLAISISGLVGFVGLVSPHLARRFLKTSLHKYVLPGSFLIGGFLLMAADTLGRTLIADKEIPAGSLSAVIGAPILIFLLLERSYAQSE